MAKLDPGTEVCQRGQARWVSRGRALHSNIGTASAIAAFSCWRCGSGNASRTPRFSIDISPRRTFVDPLTNCLMIWASMHVVDQSLQHVATVAGFSRDEWCTRQSRFAKLDGQGPCRLPLRSSRKASRSMLERNPGSARPARLSLDRPLGDAARHRARLSGLGCGGGEGVGCKMK